MASGRPGRNAALRGMKQRREGGREGGIKKRNSGREGWVFGRRCNNQTTCWLPWHAGTPAGGLGCSHEHT